MLFQLLLHLFIDGDGDRNRKRFDPKSPDGDYSDDQWKDLLGRSNLSPTGKYIGEHTIHWHLEQVPGGH